MRARFLAVSVSFRNTCAPGYVERWGHRAELVPGDSDGHDVLGGPPRGIGVADGFGLLRDAGGELPEIAGAVQFEAAAATRGPRGVADEVEDGRTPGPSCGL
ncbi:hypothetical protein GCM10020295_00490 [Streptomyces cinereospinus]